MVCFVLEMPRAGSCRKGPCKGWPSRHGFGREGTRNGPKVGLNASAEFLLLLRLASWLRMQALPAQIR